LIELFKADVTAVLCGGAVRPAKNYVQLYGGGERERDRRTRQWRTARIKRFAERQRQTREWINFAEIAEWCSKEDQSIVIAVGTVIAHRPPRRPGRAQLRHPVLTSSI
jgi:hypothetical protein